MSRNLNNLSPKLRLYLPILFGIIISIGLVTGYSVHKLRQNIESSIERNLSLEVQTISKMFEREHDLKLDKVKTDMKVAHKLFYQGKIVFSADKFSAEVVNQITGESSKTDITNWKYNGKPLYQNYHFVDEVNQLVGGTATVFQKIAQGYVRISTNVLNSDGARAVCTFIPNESPVIQTIEKGETYFGRAYVVNSWYVTAYEPIYNNGKIVGMLYVGDKEKDIEELSDKIGSLKIGESGFPFVIDEDGKFLVHPYAVGETWDDESIIKTILSEKSGVAKYILNKDGVKKICVWQYFPDFKIYIAAAMPLSDEAGSLIWEMIYNSAIIALVIIIILSLFVYFITADNVRRFLSQLEKSTKKLEQTQQALEQSEKHFQTLFNNSSDEIFVIDFDGNFEEVNQVACENLGYTRDEFLKMNVSQIKPENFRSKVGSNIETIRKFGQYRHESENQSKTGRIIPVEMKSRVVDFKGKQMILSISRDISERKEVEEKILSTIIQTEENERKRFAADLHDDLAPILSTVKLYTDLLKKKNFKKIDEEEAVRNIEELVDMAITSTRTISRNIRPNILQDFGLAAAVNDFCSFIKKTESISIEVVTHQYKIQERGIEETVLYQSVKELINNTIRHASAKSIKIELKSFENQVILYYRDDGVGFDLDEAMKQHTGLGLNNIVNKIKSVKGTVDINTKPGEGMFLIASLKLKKK
ncbi:MAG TPA: Cache 3/Cache 2 fusion domain-containing protein [Bacteroidales bacterium]|nr:Cache 3/Cache 2 fusion domain-containing protein [Bacteroidales bacterium]HRX96480.1 Cache 3/Cache 2 fusion domain-containing protein [Bacteroidales bacterium]